MGPLDIATKSAVRESPEDFARLILGGEPVASASAAESVMVRVERRLDKLLRIVRRGERVDWLHFEVQAAWEADVGERTFDYWSLSYRDHRPLRSVVICLRPGAKQGSPRGEHVVTVDGEEVLRFRFRVIRAWEDLSAPALLASGAAGLLPLVPFAKDASPELTRLALCRLDAVEPDSARTELQAALVVMASEAFQDESWLDRMPMEQLMSTTTLRKITEEAERRALVEGVALGRVEGVALGRIEQARETLLSLLRVKFGGGAPPAAQERIATADLAALIRWTERVLAAGSLDEVFAE